MTTYGDSVPTGWSCRQTYIRNHLIMDAALRVIRRAAGAGASGRKELRILELGGGVIEPLLLAALVARHWPEGIACHIDAVDASPEVYGLLHAMHGERVWSDDVAGRATVLYDPRVGSLHLGHVQAGRTS